MRVRYSLAGGPARAASLLLTTLALSGCLGGQFQPEQGRNFKDCTFRLQAIEQATLSSVDVTRVRVPADLAEADRARVVASYTAGFLPLHMRLALEITNPNPEEVVLSTLLYRVRMDGRELATGTTLQRLEVPANGKVIVRVPVNTDVRGFIRNARAGAVGDFAVGLADRQRQRRRLNIAVRPTMRFLGTTRQPSAFLIVNQDVTPEELLEQRQAQADTVETLRP